MIADPCQADLNLLQYTLLASNPSLFSNRRAFLHFPRYSDKTVLSLPSVSILHCVPTAMESKEQSYHPVPVFDDSSDSTTDVGGDISDVFLPGEHQSRRRRPRWMPSPVLSSVFVLIFLVLALIGIELTRKPTNQQCTKQLSVYCEFIMYRDMTWVARSGRLTYCTAPALEAVEYIDYDFAAEFNSTNKYRGPPTAEREDAWFNLTYSETSLEYSSRNTPDLPTEHAMEIPADKIASLNRSEADNLKHVPEEVGTGYVAIIEVFHQLHCLVSSRDQSHRSGTAGR